MAGENAYPRRLRVTSLVALEGDPDEAARLALIPPGMTTKGMYLASLAKRFDERELAALRARMREVPRHGVYHAFLDYPFADAVVLLHAAARKLFPGVGLLEGLRRLGRGSVRVYLASQAGRVAKAMINTPGEAILRLPEIWRATDPNCVVAVDEREPGVFALRVEGFPAWLDCGVIGTLEQMVLNHSREPVIDVDLQSAARAEFVVRWE